MNAALLNVFLFVPLAAALLVFAAPAARAAIAIGGAAVTVALAAILWANGLPAASSTAWLPAFGVSYNVALDGPSHLLALVTSVMTLLGLVYAVQRGGESASRGFLANVLAMETGLLGIFAARDLILFYVFFEATLVPSLFLLGMYGRADRVRAATKFALFTVFGGLLMLAAILGARYLSGAPTFALADLTARRLPLGTQYWLLTGFLVAFAVKLPIFPLHTWLPDFHAENHPSGVADLMGTLYKVGGYGLFRFALPLFPDAALELRPYLMLIAAFTAVYGAWIAFAQRDWKRLLAYSSLSHMGLVALGMFTLNPIAMTGALYLLAFQGVYTGALFLVVGMLEDRLAHRQATDDARHHAHAESERVVAHALEVGRTRGLAASAPALAGVTLALWFASIGVPGLAGFIGEFSVFLGAYQVSPWLCFIALLTTVAAAAYALTAYQRTWHEAPEAGSSVPDVRGAEWAVLAPVVAIVIVFGVYSAPALHLIQPGVNAVVQGIHSGATAPAEGVR